MRRNLESRYALAESVELCLEEHESDYAADDDLREARRKLREQLRAVCRLAQDPRLPGRGLTSQRRTVRELLVHAVVELHGIMHGWALAAGNDRVREQTRNAPYRVPALSDPALLDVARETRALLEKHRRGLEKFGMEDGLRQAFARLQKEFEVSLGPAAQAAGGGPQGVAHDEVFEELVRHIREVVDPLVWRYQQQAPKFVRAYQSARRVPGLVDGGPGFRGEPQPDFTGPVELLG